MLKKSSAVCYNGCMIVRYHAPALSGALTQLKQIVTKNHQNGKKTVVFCEDRLSLAAERAVCAAVEGTFLTSVYTFARFLSTYGSQNANVLSGQGSAMVLRKLIEENRNQLACFKKLSSPQAAQTVYDTIALLYSSRVTAEDVAKAQTANTLLSRKLADLSLLYGAYFNYLEQNNLRDRNTYLRALPQVIEQSDLMKHADVVLLGFQTFTCSTAECTTACMQTAQNVYGIFVGGRDALYVNEALNGFARCAESFGSMQSVALPDESIEEAAHLRHSLFDADTFHAQQRTKTSNVHIYKATDGDDELEYIAAVIKKQVAQGEQYRNISVMLPNPVACQSSLRRVFSQYKIPFYVDGGTPLSSHFICAFLTAYLSCVSDGCLPESVNAVVSNTLFDAPRKQKDTFRNYALRMANYRGGVKREVKEDICQNLGFDYVAVTSVRAKFTQGLALFPNKGTGKAYGEAILQLLRLFDVEKRLSELSQAFTDTLPLEAAFCARVYAETVKLVEEAARLTESDVMSAREFLKLLKSGFAADNVNIIPPKQDAVFVGDISTTANTGSNVVFAARLTDAVPAMGADTALLTDRELSSLEDINLVVSPKISLVNMRVRETTALNICAFKRDLYVSYPLRLDGVESTPSEVVDYVSAVFATRNDNAIEASNKRALDKSGSEMPWQCSEPVPALRQLARTQTQAWASAVYGVLKENGLQKQADAALQPDRKKTDITLGKQLFLRYGSLSPTTLESYFSCPYLGFMSKGLRLAERQVGAVRATDTGSFIHTVMQNTALKMNDAEDEVAMQTLCENEANALLQKPPYAALLGEKSGQYTATKLVEEAVAVCLGAYRQVANSKFKVSATESTCKLPLNDGVNLFGYIDRVDSFDDMVRVIDYKTGSIDTTPEKFYLGLKLQLQLYLLAASKGRRAIGAYYFPATVDYCEKKDGDFRLLGFMENSDDVVTASDINLVNGQKSEYVNVKRGAKPSGNTLMKEDFADFLQYGALVARKGAEEMISGYIAPSPIAETCKYCKMGGCCGFSKLQDGSARAGASITCEQIAKIVQEERGDNDDA